VFHGTRIGLAALALVLALAIAPSALAASAVDQYSEGIPTAGGQEPTHEAVTEGQGAAGGGTAAIPRHAQSELQRSKPGSAAEKAAELSAPSRSDSGSVSLGGSDAGDGVGLLLPVILVAALITAVAIFLARRRPGATPG
jgi:hypothetical protein